MSRSDGQPEVMTDHVHTPEGVATVLQFLIQQWIQRYSRCPRKIQSFIDAHRPVMQLRSWMVDVLGLSNSRPWYLILTEDGSITGKNNDPKGDELISMLGARIDLSSINQ